MQIPIDVMTASNNAIIACICALFGTIQPKAMRLINDSEAYGMGITIVEEESMTSKIIGATCPKLRDHPDQEQVQVMTMEKAKEIMHANLWETSQLTQDQLHDFIEVYLILKDYYPMLMEYVTIDLQYLMMIAYNVESHCWIIWEVDGSEHLPISKMKTTWNTNSTFTTMTIPKTSSFTIPRRPQMAIPRRPQLRHRNDYIMRNQESNYGIHDTTMNVDFMRSTKRTSSNQSKLVVKFFCPICGHRHELTMA